ncbi:MAG: adenylate/guanylate cyclase domain-containing protein [Arenicellales bacterium]|nr:adenylate/guanylate cyclase domain-containing protein [Arenicellales bacterium]
MLSRQQAAIVYADVANYSGLCAIDEDGTHKLLEEYLSVFTAFVDEHDGRVHHYAGDAVLATFEHAEAAVTCAVSIQKKLLELNEPIPTGRRVEFRIGINEGAVIPTRGDVFGEDVNVAARLESLSTPGGICISERVKQVVDEKALRATITYLGERSFKNLPRRIRAYLLEVGDVIDQSTPQFRSRTGAWLQLPRQPSLAVLPFECLDDDLTAMRFADGLTMEVMTELIKLSGLFLASDFSSLRYRKQHPSAQAVSRDLGVRYLLQGTVKRSVERLRVYAQLIDAMNGARIWAERYDETLDDIFEIQDSITDSIITALDVKLVSGERSHITRKSLLNREALRHYYNGWSHLVAGTREDLILAQREFETAAELEPKSPLPPAMASWTYWWVGFRVLTTDSKNAFERAEHLAKRAKSMEDPSGFSSLVMANLYLLRREHRQALEAAEYALNLRPSCDVSAATFANILNYLDRSEEAIQFAEQAIRLTPIAPTIYPGILASSYYGAGRYEEAIAAAHAIIDLNADATDAWLVLAAAESAVQNYTAARAAMDQVLRVKPDLTVDAYLQTQPYANQKRAEELADRLRSAGLH